MGTNSSRSKQLVLGLSLAWCLVATVWAVATMARRPGTSSVVDRSREIRALLERRRSSTDTAGRALGRLPRSAIDPETARTLFAALESPLYQFDPDTYFRLRSGLSVLRNFKEHPAGRWEIRTNDLGLRDDEVLGERPDLRVLLTGDSQTQGVCSNDETVAAELERLLAPAYRGGVEVVNAAVGSFGPYQYLGTLERLRALRPDVFVVVLYAGNDFHDLMLLQRYFEGRGPPEGDVCDIEAVAERLGEQRAIMYSEGSQLGYFVNNPGDVEVALDTLTALALEIARQCEELGARPLFAVLPGPLSGQPDLYRAERQRLAAAIGQAPGDLELGHLLTDAYLASLELGGLSTLDLRPAFAASERRLFWKTDMHLDLEGNRVVARELAAATRELAPE